MGKLFRFVTGLAVSGGALAALTYHLQKKGVVNIEVNYDDKDGNPVTKPIDQIVDENVDILKAKANEAFGDFSQMATDVAQDVKQTAKEQFDSISSQFKKDKDTAIDLAQEAACEAKEAYDKAESALAEDFNEVKASVDDAVETAKTEVKESAAKVKSAVDKAKAATPAKRTTKKTD